MDDLARLLNSLRAYRNQQCLLFVGAGFSAGAHRRDSEGQSVPIEAASGLIKILKDRLNEEIDDLGALADLYEERFGEHGLFDLLTSSFIATTVSESQLAIMNYRWKEVYTTNYDNVLELCAAQNGKQFSTYTTSKRPEDVDYKTLPLIHINGYVAGAVFNDFRKEIKLTNTQYFSDDFSRSPWGTRFRNDIITSPCIVFAGYSLYDLDVARILNTFEGMKERIFFIFKDAPSPANEKKLRQFGSIITIGTDGLAKSLSDIEKEKNREEIYLSAWESVQLPQSSRPARDIDVINFLMSGNIDESLFANDLIERAYKVSVNRTASDQVVDLLSQGKLKYGLITSNAGNGKTTALDSIAFKLRARGFAVYRGGPHKSLLLKELPLVKQIPGRTFLILDDAFANIDVVRAVHAIGRDDLHLIAGARTAQYELQEAEIKRAFGDRAEAFSLDWLNDSEISALISFLDDYGLWGKRQSLSNERKDAFVRVECARELRSVVLELLDSPNIRSRIEDILKFEGKPDEQDRTRSVLVISQLLNLAQQRADLNLISEMVQFDARKVILEQEKSLRDFSLNRDGRISMRSSIFAEYLLKRIIDTGFVIHTLTRCMTNLDVIHGNDELYRQIFRNFSRFAFVESAIAVDKRLVHMVKYFENIKTLLHCREEPLFWLQYAMCRLSLKQYREASRLFEVAYAFAEKSGYRENRHLNNQFARFLLESRSNTNEYTDYMPAFNKAHGICIRQMRDEQSSYSAYRVAQNYLGFLDRRLAELNSGDLVAIVRSCGEVTTQITRRKANKEISDNRIVDECAKAMRSTVELARRKLKELGVDI
jgi:hypothetical protein